MKQISMFGKLAFLIVVILFPKLSEALEFKAEYLYRVNSTESMAVAEKRAYIKAKQAVIDKVITYVNKNDPSKAKRNRRDLEAVIDILLKKETTEIKTVSKNELRYQVIAKLDDENKIIDLTDIKPEAKQIVCDLAEVFAGYDANFQERERLTRDLARSGGKIEKDAGEKKLQQLDNEFLKFYHFESGLVSYINEEYSDAMVHLTMALDADAEFVKAYYYRGLTYKVYGLYNNATSDLKKVSAVNPKNSAVYYNLGSIYFNQGKINNAIKELTRAIEIKKDFEDALSVRGVAFVKMADYDLAINDLTALLMLNSKSVSAYYNRGYAYFKKGEFRQAIEDTTTAIEMNDSLAEAYYIRGASYAKLHDKTRGRLDIEKACNLNYEDACALMSGRSTIHDKNVTTLEHVRELIDQGKTEEALDQLQKYINKENEEYRVLLGLVYVRLGKPREALSTIGDIRVSSEYAFNTIRKNKTQTFNAQDVAVIRKYYYATRFIAGVAEYQQENCQGALAELLEYVEYDISDASALDIIGSCYYKAGKYDESLKYYRIGYEILQGDDKKISAAYSIASLHALLGNATDAIAWLKIAVNSKFKTQVIEKAVKDEDFKSLRENDEYRRLVGAGKKGPT